MMAHIAYIGRKKVQEVKTDAVYFSPSEFVQKLVRFLLLAIISIGYYKTLLISVWHVITFILTFCLNEKKNNSIL